MAFYTGFSSFEFQKNKSFKLTDVELVKLDLLNHIFTRKGERVMMPNFGTTIPDLVFEPLDSETMLTIEDELRNVFQYDPRVSLLEFSLEPAYDENKITVHSKIQFIELNVTSSFDFNIEFEGGA
jgi:hypothetical protein